MPAKRRRLTQLRGKVARCSSLSQLQKLIDSSGDRLLFIHFTSMLHAACKKMSAFLTDISRKAEYSHIRFAEIDVQADPDVVKALGVKGLPGVQCYRAGECLENNVFAAPYQVIEALQKHGGPRPRREPAPWWKTTMKAIAVGAVATAGFLLARAVLGTNQDSLQAELSSLEKRIAELREVAVPPKGRRRRSKKEIRAAKKKLQDLEARRQQLQAAAARSGASAARGEGSDEDDDGDDEEEASAERQAGGRGEEAEEREEIGIAASSGLSAESDDEDDAY